MPHPLSLFPRASGITGGAHEDYGGYMNGHYEGHARLRADGAAATDGIGFQPFGDLLLAEADRLTA